MASRFETNVNDVYKEVEAIKRENERLLHDWSGIPTTQLRAWISDKEDEINRLKHILKLKEEK